MILAGNLREEIVLERRTIDQNGQANGDILETWTMLLKTRASVKMMSAEEQIKAGRLVSDGRLLIHIRYRTDLVIEVGDRLTWRTKIGIVEKGIEIDQSRTTIKLIVNIVADTSDIKWDQLN